MVSRPRAGVSKGQGGGTPWVIAIYKLSRTFGSIDTRLQRQDMGLIADIPASDGTAKMRHSRTFARPRICCRPAPQTLAPPMSHLDGTSAMQ